MPLIQRNLFPSRPPSKKNDGPSILRANNNIGNQQQTTIVNPMLTMYTTANKLKSLDSSMKNANKLYSNHKNNNQNNNNNNNPDKKDAKKLRKSQSASMISLLAINHSGSIGKPNINGSGRKVGGGGGGGGAGNTPATNHNNNNNKINYDSQDSFNSSDASCSDPQSLCSSSSSVDNMISRRRILSKSKDALNNSPSTVDDFSNDDGFDPAHQPSSMHHHHQPPPPPPPDEDVWHNQHQLISDHIEEILTKWDQIDDEIWAKVICMERNRRVAKAYARTPILTINGYEAGFDGHRIGLNGFENPMRDRKTMEIKNRIEDGIKLRMDQDGSLLVKRLTDVDVFILSNDKLDVCVGHKIEQRKSIVLFDMKQYQNELLKEIKSSMPNLRVLEQRCFCFVTFGQYAEDLLTTPVWCIIINLVALEMLVKLIPYRISDDNFYSLPLSLSSKINGYFNGFHSSSSMPPKLPPRDLHNKKPPLTLPEPDYEDDTNNNDDDQNHLDLDENDENVIRSTMVKSMATKIVDDPYYHGLSAHVPKFAHPTRQANLARSQMNAYNNNSSGNIGNNHHHHPPIVRRAMNKKSWNNDHMLFGAGNNNNNNNNNNHEATPSPKNGSTFDPMTLLPINDNNEIYGVNPSLLRNKNRPFHIRSSSSPSLKNIFSRKTKTVNQNKDPRIH